MSVTVSATANQEPIPGYVLVERLGSGGYGEVWKVEAPGGLHKALKIIYGFVSEDRAARELKALHHLREVRHPFILSLERIEVIDGRLMIITELAESCLVDRYRACREQNLPGIPRDELLAYLRDAAEALDFMIQMHSLQHLDVKPENLLLVGGRAKVADFGLVKEIADQTRSLVGAMTPTYASPELFDGRASRQSDQYSLAIVYQEMLTGTLPFPGKTAAQLAAQHTRNRAQVAALPSADRDILLRALSKTPADRFASCRELIDHLAQASAATRRGSSAAHPATDEETRSLPRDDEQARTEEISGRSSHGARDSAKRSSAEQPREPRASVKVSTQTVDLPVTAVPSGINELHPALFIGSGGTGALTLARLTTRLVQRFGEQRASAAFPMLALDTDATSIQRATSAGLDRGNVKHVHLRQAHEYRSTADQLLPWLGRRWLYNIPKSGQASGIRPWGRLALIDHASTVVSKLRQRIVLLTSDSAAEALASDGYDRNRPMGSEVFIVSAAGGGTGSGTLLELAYAVRNITRRLEQGAPRVTAVIAMPSPHASATRQLALTNTLALLTEIQHYVRCGAQGAGSADARLAMFEGPDFPFDDVYLVEMTEEPTPEALARHIDMLADYLYCRVATPLGAAALHARAPQPEEEQHRDLQLRSFRLRRWEEPEADATPEPESEAPATNRSEAMMLPDTAEHAGVSVPPTRDGNVTEQIAPLAQVAPRSAPAMAIERAPRRFSYGCLRRTYLLVPAGQHVDEKRVQECVPTTAFQQLAIHDDAVYTCEELEGISLAQVAHRVEGMDPQISAAVEHLHTRVDLPWTQPAAPDDGTS